MSLETHGLIDTDSKVDPAQTAPEPKAKKAAAAPPPKPAKPGTVYSRAELIQAGPGAFGVSPETVAGALALAGLTEATREQAAAAIKRYLNHRIA